MRRDKGGPRGGSGLGEPAQALVRTKGPQSVVWVQFTSWWPERAPEHPAPGADSCQKWPLCITASLSRYSCHWRLGVGCQPLSRCDLPHPLPSVQPDTERVQGEGPDEKQTSSRDREGPGVQVSHCALMRSPLPAFLTLLYPSCSGIFFRNLSQAARPLPLSCHLQQPCTMLKRQFHVCLHSCPQKTCDTSPMVNTRLPVPRQIRDQGPGQLRHGPGGQPGPGLHTSVCTTACPSAPPEFANNSKKRC